MTRFVRLGLLTTIAVLATAGLLLGCASEGGVVDNQGLRDLQAEGARIIDVRTEAEYGAGYIPGSENVPMMGLSRAAASWDPAEPIVLYCATGSRSAEAAQILRSLGFERVYDLPAGIIAWDGEITQPGVASSGTTAPPPSAASGTPVLYEFYTDW